MSDEWQRDEMVQEVDALQTAGWIVQRMGRPFDGTVHSILPDGFDAYARIFHPAVIWDGSNAVPVSWSRVAESTGSTVHPAMNWESIYRLESTLRVDDAPSLGCLPRQVRRDLTSILSRFTADREDCFFAFWEGNFDEGEFAAGGKFVLNSGRSYYLFEGPVTRSDHLFEGESPNMWWPRDAEWIVSTDIDLMSTFVGGSESCIAQIVESKDIEALRVEISQSITSSSDLINRRR
ncbi:hypothetical protein ABIC28_005182 [Rhodococcus sp. PvR044]|uniref:hypothetical protein n=1 Tax=Rhodococcus sp. PvR044 TaxID=3156402 RepID=UPI0033941050